VPFTSCFGAYELALLAFLLIRIIIELNFSFLIPEGLQNMKVVELNSSSRMSVKYIASLSRKEKVI
jgi:hypothetical protein